MKTPFTTLSTMSLITAFLLIGCKPRQNGTDTGAGSQNATIAYVTNGVDPFWDLCAAGVRIAEKEFSVKCEVHMPTKGVVDQKQQRNLRGRVAEFFNHQERCKYDKNLASRARQKRQNVIKPVATAQD